MRRISKITSVIFTDFQTKTTKDQIFDNEHAPFRFRYNFFKVDDDDDVDNKKTSSNQYTVVKYASFDGGASTISFNYRKHGLTQVYVHVVEV